MTKKYWCRYHGFHEMFTETYKLNGDLLRRMCCVCLRYGFEYRLSKEALGRSYKEYLKHQKNPA